MNPKVLVGIVTYDGKDYIFPECYKAVRNLDYDNYDVLIVDNSKGNSYYTKLLREGYKNVVHLQRAKNTRDTLSDSQNYIRHRMLDGNYDYLLMVESDLLPPPETITRLLNHNKLVTGSLYWLQGKIPGQEGKFKIPCIFFLEYKKESQAMGTRLITYQELPSFLNTGLRQVHGCGIGCTLFARSIVEKYPYWTDERFDNKHSDVYLYMDLHNNHIPVFVDTSFEVPHFPSDWGQVIDR
jgi:glycosyltransferase involved in cell wall biosynthesis